jgi:hypothetical protein
MFILVWAGGRLATIARNEYLAEEAKERAIREREEREAAKEDAEKSRADFDFMTTIEQTLGRRREK